MSELRRTIGPVLLWGLGVGYVISGMYFGWNLGLPVGGPYGMLAATIVVTVLYLTFVLGYAELACAMPRAGGVFVYTSRAFGPHVGFVGGTAQLVEYLLAPPAVAFAIGGYINQMRPDLPITAIAFIAYFVFTVINIAGVRLSVGFELALTVLAIAELCVFGAVTLPEFSWPQFSADPLPQGWAGAFAALPFAMWFYLAIEGVANVAEETRDPQRVIPRSFVAAMATLVVLAAITLFGAVGVAGWQSVVYDPAKPGVPSDSPLPLAISQIVSRDHALFQVLTAVGLIGLVASFHSILIAGSRAILELGRVGYAPRILGEVNARTHTPVAALLTNMVIGFVVLLTGKTGDIILIAVFGALTLYILSSAALLKLRRKTSGLPAAAVVEAGAGAEPHRPYRTPGYPATPIIALVLSLVCVAAMAWSYPKQALIYLAILGGSWVLFAVFVPASRRTTF
jgi:ethanolamine permease